MQDIVNEIVVYQPDETLRLEVRLESETVWLTQEQMCKLFGRTQPVIARHIGNIFKEGELDKNVVYAKFAYTTRHGAIAGKTQTQEVGLYNLDVVISVGYRVKSIQGTRFRQWATSVLKEYLLRGYSINARINQLEDKVDRRLADHDKKIDEIKEKVDFFVRTSLPPVQGIFYNGQVFDAHVFAARHILSAQKSIFLIDNWVDVITLEILSKKITGVTVEIITSRNGNRLARSYIDTFNKQSGSISVRESTHFHDRFLIIYDK
ncbi:MAG: virulence RhuM family protein, partial [Victivallales bacterium]|nr:virulence RhuM family protein [Victivallales bacterium]